MRHLVYNACKRLVCPAQSVFNSWLRNMPNSYKHVVTRYLLLLILTPVFMLPSSAASQKQPLTEQNESLSSKLDEERLHWSQLKYKATLLGFSVKSQVNLVSLPANETDAALIESKNDKAVSSSSDNNYYMTLHTNLLGRDLRTMIWFDPTDVRALQRIRLETGVKQNEYKAYRFTENGTFMIRKQPKTEEVDLSHESWTNTNSEYAKLLPKSANQLMLAEPASLFYIVSVAELSHPGDAIEIPMLSRGSVLMVRLTVEKRKTYNATYTRKKRSSDNEVNHNVDALEISIRARSIDSPTESFDLKLAGLDGDLRFIVDRETHIPLELSGKMVILGTVRFKLEHAVVH